MWSFGAKKNRLPCHIHKVVGVLKKIHLVHDRDQELPVLGSLFRYTTIKVMAMRGLWHLPRKQEVKHDMDRMLNDILHSFCENAECSAPHC